MRLRIFVFLCTLLCCSASWHAWAQSADGTPDDSLRRIRQVEVTASRVASNVASSKPIQTMTREEIDRLGLNELSEVVKRFAGSNVRDYGGIGGMKTVSVRNLGAQHTAVSYDGLTISNTQAGQIDIGRFSLDNVESVTMAVGNEESLMQTARHYASAGILSVRTERPTFGEGRGYRLKAQLRAGSFGLLSPSFRYWQKLGGRTVLALDGTYMRADGAYPYELVNGKNRTDEKRHNSDINSWKGEANLFHTFSDGSALDTKLYWFYSERGLPGSVVYYNRTARERLWDEDFFAQTSYNRQMGREWKLAARLKFTHSWNQYEDYGPNYVSGKMRDVNRQDEYYGNVTLGWLPADNFSVALAQDISVNTLRNNVHVASNDGPSNPVRTTSVTALTAHWTPTRLSLDGGLVGTYAHERVAHGSQPSDKHRLSPFLSVSWQVPGADGLRLRAMAKGTFRMPTFNDLYYRRIGNTGLRPEKAKEYNVGITWTGRPLTWTRYLSFTADLFHNNVTDKIVAFPSTYVWKMSNFGKTVINGIDITMAGEAEVTKRVAAVLTLGYSYQKAVDRQRKSASYRKQLPYTPRHSGNISLSLNNPWVNVGYSIVMQGERWSSAQNTDTYKIDAYWEHTLTLSRSFQFSRWRLDLIGSVRNLTDAQYEIIKFYPMPGRSAELTARVTL